MKKLICLPLILFVSAVIVANVPDMEFFLPTEYQFMTELNKNEAQDFIQGKEDFLKKCDYINNRVLEGRESSEQKILYQKGRVFSENVNGEQYIWVVLPCTRNELYSEIQKNCDWVPEHQYIIALFRAKETQSELLFCAPTYFFDTAVFYIVNTFQIIKGKSKNMGIIHYRNMLRYGLTCDSNNHTNGVSYRTMKGQAEGAVLANYYLFDEKSQFVEFEKEDNTYDFIYRPINWNKISIQPSPFLWDMKKPLKYGLQNAFDQNPATSFVENTDNDLMTIELPLINGKNGKPFEKIAVINGYAANENLYEANNSVKEIGLYDFKPIVVDGEKFAELSKKQNILCASKKLNYQVFELSNKFYTLKVDSIYKGTKYNDTCLAELNFFCDDEWIFGDIDE